MGNLLFSPSGRLGPSGYMRGIIIIAVIGAVIQLLPILSPVLGTVGGLISLVLLYCFIALGIKRSHDAGKSGWMVITHVLLSLGVGAVLGFIVSAITGVSAGSALSAGMSGDTEALEALTAATTSASYLIPAALAGLVGQIVTGFLVNMFNKQDLGDNQYGPVPLA